MLTQHFMSDSLCQQKLMELQLLLEALFNVRSTRESTRGPGAEKASLAKFCKGCTHQHVFGCEVGVLPAVPPEDVKAVSLIAQGCPRGSKQLIGPFSSLFGPADAAAWFRERGVALKTEGDGRMFPQSDDSQTIIDCLQDAARKAGVHVISSAKVASFSCRTSHERGSAEDSALQDTAGVAYGAEAQPRFDLIVSTATPLSNTVLDLLGAAEVTYEATMETGETGTGNRRGKRIYAISCDYVLQATGAARGGHVWAKQLGHAVSPAVPSLFTLTVKDPRLESLAGLSVQDAELKLFPESNSAIAAGKERTASTDAESSRADQGLVAESGAVEARQGLSDAATVTASAKKINAKRKKKNGISQRGPLLITHSGFSGPAALKLSALGARELKESGYRGKLVVNWLAGNNANKAIDELLAFRTQNAKKAVHSFCPLGGVGGTADSPGVPRRLWQRLALAAGVTAGEKWAEVAKAKLVALAQQLTVCEFEVVGKGSFKEEFVTCGGVSLSELDMRTMESRGVPGLYFAGEVVDIDGVTGGYNFQSAWTTGWVAGSAIGARAAHAAIKRRVAICPEN